MSVADSVFTFDSSLLTPPMSLHDDERPPFVPLDSDKVSLSMKKSDTSAKQRRRLNRACASSGDAIEEQKNRNQVERSRTRTSLPDLKKYRRPLIHPVLSEPGNHAWVDQKLQKLSAERGRGSSNALCSDSRRIPGISGRPRRWTVPTKAQPTHIVCFANHVTPTATRDKLPAEPLSATPAMIILRRATTKKQVAPSIPQTNITFFPPPKFNRTSTPLLSFLRMASQQGQVHTDCLNTNASMTRSPRQSIAPSPPRRPSVTKECARPCCSVTAEPAVTNVLAHSAREHDPSQQFDGPGYRRFSTKIISDSSVHEIIWDENAMSGESTSSSSNVSRQPTTNQKRAASSQIRKQSIAMEKLEKQLRRDSSDARRVLPVKSPEIHRSHQKSFQSLLNFKFGEAKASNGDSQIMPRSRTSLSLGALGAKEKPQRAQRRKTQGPHAGVRDDIVFFPPLNGQTPIRSQEHITIQDRSPRRESRTGCQQKSSMGHGIGQSRHMRRKSAATHHHHAESVRGFAGTINEHMPLLSQTGLDGFWSRGEMSRPDEASYYQPSSAGDGEGTVITHEPSSPSRLRRVCDICDFSNDKKRMAKLEREVQELKHTINSITKGKATVSIETDGGDLGGRVHERLPLPSQTGLDGMWTAAGLPEGAKRRKACDWHSKWRLSRIEEYHCSRCDPTCRMTHFNRITVLEGKVQALEKASSTTKQAKGKATSGIDQTGMNGHKERCEVQEVPESREQKIAKRGEWQLVGKASGGATENEK